MAAVPVSRITAATRTAVAQVASRYRSAAQEIGERPQSRIAPELRL
jgi:hypothetical protein